MIDRQTERQIHGLRRDKCRRGGLPRSAAGDRRLRGRMGTRWVEMPAYRDEAYVLSPWSFINRSSPAETSRSFRTRRFVLKAVATDQQFSKVSHGTISSFLKEAHHQSKLVRQQDLSGKYVLASCSNGTPTMDCDRSG